MNPRKRRTNGSNPPSPRSRGALQDGIAILVCLAAFGTPAAQARALQFCPSAPDAAPKVVAGAGFTPIIPHAAVWPSPVEHALRIASGFVIRISQQPQAVAVRVATIIGFRG